MALNLRIMDNIKTTKILEILRSLLHIKLIKNTDTLEKETKNLITLQKKSDEEGKIMQKAKETKCLGIINRVNTGNKYDVMETFQVTLPQMDISNVFPAVVLGIPRSGRSGAINQSAV